MHSLIQTRLAGVTCSLKVSYLRRWYVVELPCGVQIKVNPKAHFDGIPVQGNNAAVAHKAVVFAEEWKPSSKFGKMLRDWSSSQCIEGKAWCAK